VIGDVALLVPVVETPSIAIPYDAGRAWAAGGVIGDVQLHAFHQGTIFAHGGLRGWTQGTGAGATSPRGWVSVVELEGMQRWGNHWNEHGTGVFFEAGTGVHVALFGGTNWALHVNPALGGHVGLGGVVGTGSARLLVEGRATATARTDQYYGSLITPEGDVGWTYNPGRAGIELLVGVELGPAEK